MFRDPDDFNAQLHQWSQEVADLRVDGTTHQRPIERFAEEAAALVPTASHASFLEAMLRERVVADDLTVQGQSQIAIEALDIIGELYAIEREATELDAEARQRLRQEQARPILERLHGWLLQRRGQVPNGSAIARAIDYSLKRWAALTHYVDDGRVPIDNNWIENQIRPIALGRKNWLFAGSLRDGQRAAAIMSLIQSARLNGNEPFAYLKDV